MRGFIQWSALSLGVLLGLTVGRADALPGQRTEEVTAWINANPTLRPAVGDSLSVSRYNTAAQRFTFRASVSPPGRITLTRNPGTVRTESYYLYDMINGVTSDRLQESLRVLYGVDLYQDYERAQIVYKYPTPETIDQSRRQKLPLLAAQQGELRLGERFAYWMEVTQTPQGKAFNGQMTIFLREDLDKLETELRNR